MEFEIGNRIKIKMDYGSLMGDETILITEKFSSERETHYTYLVLDGLKKQYIGCTYNFSSKYIAEVPDNFILLDALKRNTHLPGWL